eukprot:s2548_g3.t1
MIKIPLRSEHLASAAARSSSATERLAFLCLFLSSTTMLSSIFLFIVGTGIGAYNAEQLRPCLGDSAKAAKEKATPVMKQMSAQVAEQARPYLEKVQDQISSMRGNK